MRVCWNRQTGKLEVLVFDWTCGFKSHHSHHFLFRLREKNFGYARVVELADSLDSGSSAHYGRAGSSPASRTMKKILTVSDAVRIFCRKNTRAVRIFLTALVFFAQLSSFWRAR